MSSDPHPPLPSDPAPDERTEVRPATPDDPFAVPRDAPLAGDAPASAGAGEAGEAADRAARGAPEPPLDVPAPAAPVADEPVRPTPTVPFASASPDRPAGTAAPEGFWRGSDAGASAARPAPDPFVPRPPSSTPSGAPEAGLAEKARAFAEQAREKAQPLAEQARPYAEQAREKAQPLIEQARPYAEQAREKAQPLVEKARPLTEKAQPLAVKAQAFADRPEGKVAVAFAGGVAASLVLKVLGKVLGR